jgi:hypothetical protein
MLYSFILASTLVMANSGVHTFDKNLIGCEFTRQEVQEEIWEEAFSSTIDKAIFPVYAQVRSPIALQAEKFVGIGTKGGFDDWIGAEDGINFNVCY